MSLHSIIRDWKSACDQDWWRELHCGNRRMSIRPKEAPPWPFAYGTMGIWWRSKRLKAANLFYWGSREKKRSHAGWSYSKKDSPSRKNHIGWLEGISKPEPIGGLTIMSSTTAKTLCLHLMVPSILRASKIYGAVCDASWTERDHIPARTSKAILMNSSFASCLLIPLSAYFREFQINTISNKF